MPVSPDRLLRDEPSRADPHHRDVVLVPGTLALSAALERARQDGVSRAIVVQRTGGGYDLIDWPTVRQALEPPGDDAPVVVAVRQALQDPAVTARPVQDAPMVRVSAEVAAAGSISTRDAVALAHESPLQLLVVVTGTGEFLGVLDGSAPFAAITRFFTAGYIAVDASTRVADAFDLARRANLGAGNPVFFRLPEGEWAANAAQVLEYVMEKGGADAPLERLPYDYVPALDEEDATQERAEEIASEAPGRQLIVLRDGEVIGYLGDAAREMRGFETAAIDPHDTSALPPQPRFVNTAFVPAEDPEHAVARDTSLRAGGRYYFRLDIGAYSLESLAAGRPEDAFPEELLPGLSGGLPLRVLVFNDGFAQLEQDVGELALYPEGPAAVVARAAEVAGLAPDRLERYLFFGVRAPGSPGSAALRASIYYQGNLVQSWRVTAEVTPDGAPRPGALRAERDFTLVASLKPDRVHVLPERKLNILVNENGDGTHGIYVAGEAGLKAGFNIPPDQARTAADRYRARLREAMYRNPDAADPQTLQYRYGADNGGSVDVLSDALMALANAGANFFDSLFNQAAPAAGGFQVARALRAELRAPATLQCVVRQDGTWAVPWAGVYDYPLLSVQSEWKICDAFLAALGQPGLDLAQEPCFQGQCPHYGDRVTVCPSGFWGFRHVIEAVPSLGDREVALAIPRDGGARVDMGVSTDPRFELRAAHTQALGGLPGVSALHSYETYAAILKMLMESRAQIVYFFCHGGRSGTTPYLSIDDPQAGKIISPRDVDALGLDWSGTRPLVFINGCHTVDLMPEDLLSFAQRFMQVANAAGVLGTEITIVERFATEFGLGFMGAFAAGGPLGAALRACRLQLLKKGNPLGLVYTPYGHADLRLV